MQYLYALGTRPLAAVRNGGAWEYLLPDALGSVRQFEVVYAQLGDIQTALGGHYTHGRYCDDIHPLTSFLKSMVKHTIVKQGADS
jgi:hypothetical protein